MKSNAAFTKTCVSYRFSDLKIPRIIKASARDMPYTSAIHYVSDSIKIIYPPESFVSQFVKGGVRYLFNVQMLTKRDNVKGRGDVAIGALVSMVKRQANYLKPCIDTVKAHNSENAIIVYNYGLLNPTVKYARKPNTPYCKWNNLRSTLWENVNDAIEKTGAVQIVPFNLPMNMPPYEEYMKLDKDPSIPIIRLKTWSNEEVLDIQDILRFLGRNRQYSNLNRVAPHNYKKVILCFQLINGCAVYYNLGDLDGYIKKDATKEEEENYDEETSGNIPPENMQRRVLKTIQLLINYNIDNLPETPPDDVPVTADANTDQTKATDAPETAKEQENQKTVETVAERIARMRRERKLANASPDSQPETETSSLSGVVDIDIPEMDTKPDESSDVIDFILNKDDDADHNDDEIIMKLAKAAKGIDIADSDLDIQEDDDVASDDELVFNEDTIAKLPQPKGDTIFIDTKVNDIEKGVVDSALTLMRKGVITGNEAKRMATLAKSYTKIPNPFKAGETLEDLARLDEQEMSIVEPEKIPDLLTVPNKALLESKLPTFEKQYVSKYLNKHVAKCVLGIQKAGVAVTGYNIETVKNASDEYQHLTITVVSPLGTSSNLHAKIPVIKEDGTYKSNGSIYRLRNQRVDVPIRKIKADEVGLSSYYGKLYVNRGRKQSNNYDIKLYQAIKKAQNNEDSPVSVKYVNGDVFMVPNHYCRDYSGLSKHIVKLTLDNKYILIFSQEKLHEELDTLDIEYDSGQFVVGYNSETKLPIYMDDHCRMVCGEEQLGTIGDYIGINEGKLPRDQAYIEIFGTSIPVGLVLSYYYGLHELLNVTGIQYEITTKRIAPTRDTAVIKFVDCYLSYDANHRCAPIFNSLASVAKIIKEKMFMEFEDPNNFNRIFTLCGFSIGHLREIDSLQTLFIDPITEDRLVEMKEPKEFKPLLIRASEMLKDDYYKFSNDFSEQIIRGYERVPGLMYEQIAKAVRSYNTRNPTRRSKIALDNYAVWNSITTDPTIIQVENINPIHNLKEKESITFTGTGGRKKDTMTRPTRVFLDTDKGIISDATKDSSSVGIEAVMVASPKIKDFHGFTERFDDDKDNAANLLSTTALLYPYSDIDD